MILKLDPFKSHNLTEILDTTFLFTYILYLIPLTAISDALKYYNSSEFSIGS